MTEPAEAQANAQATSSSGVETTTATCPVPCSITVTTRAGGIPVSGVLIESDGQQIGHTNSQGIVTGTLNACEGSATMRAIYENLTARVKAEEVTLDISGIDATAGTATGGQARNFIAKVQDVFGSGDGGFPGDKDFEDSYAGADLVSVENGTVKIQLKLATISLAVPYRNQNDAGETINSVTTSGAVLCMPTSAEMQGRYWGIEKVTPPTTPDGEETRTEITRHDIMQQAYSQATSSFSLTAFPRHWQDWGNLRTAVQTLVDASSADTYSVGNGPAGGGVETIPSTYANSLKDLLATGVPTVTSTYATNGHVMIVIGAVVKHDDEAEWLILNDPNGTLASTSSIYGDLDIVNPVGLRGTSTAPVMNQDADVRAVQEVLTRLGYYSGDIGADVDEADPNDATVAAITAFQGNNADGRIDEGGNTESRLNAQIDAGTSPKYSNVENERNGATGDRGRHVYYNGGTEGARNGRFRLKGRAWSCVVTPDTALTTEEIQDRLNVGTRQ